MTSPSGGTRRRRAVAVPLTALVIAAALGTVAALGGFAEAPKESPRRLGPGGVVDQKLFLTRFLASRTVFQPGRYGGAGKRFLEIEIEVTNKGRRTEEVGSPGEKGLLYGKSLLRVTPALGEDSAPVSAILDEGVPSRQLHPGTTSTVVFRYELPRGLRPPEEVRLDVGTFDPSPESFTGADLGLVLETDGKAAGAPPKVAAQVVLPVERKGTGR
ncbi:hypothetical protein HS041_07360 [Planomonospora sp. ID67723]|uniref:hypothetical protein n=1 Tax=Planomonospora sp. ID67723 TaxID=2738134 RepID=UPI0018C3642E|nr:hypothetical protein [Planomonospora sp. ID67723]MBG0827579.1 hypothetical protein [Planomonospora sp. ID67723]